MAANSIECHGMVAVLDDGTRIAVIPGEGASPECFAGENLNPSARDLRLNAHVSCFWLRSKVVSIEPLIGSTHA